MKSNINIAEDLAAFMATKKYHVDRAKANVEGVYTSLVTNIDYSSYQEYLFDSKELGDAAREEGSGYNSILTTDITKKGESMFNSPRVVFEKGDVLGETPGEVIKNTKIAETSTEAPVAPVDKVADIERRRAAELKEQSLEFEDVTFTEEGWAEPTYKKKPVKELLDVEFEDDGTPVPTYVEAEWVTKINEKYDAELAALKATAAPVTKKKKFKRGSKSKGIIDNLGENCK